MAYTPPATVPLNLDLTGAGYSPPVNPVVLELDPPPPGSYALSGANALCVATSTPGNIVSDLALSGAPVTQGATSSAGAIVQTYALLGQNTAQGNASTSAPVDLLINLAGESCVQGATSSISAISQLHPLSGQNALQVNASTSQPIQAPLNLLGNSCLQGATSNTGTIGQTHTLIAQNVLQSNTSTSELVDASFHLSADPCLQGATSNTGQISLGWPKFATSSAHAVVQQARPVTQRACVKQHELGLAARKLEVDQDTALPVRTKISAVTDALDFKVFRYCVPVESGDLIIKSWLSMQDELTLTTIKRCGTVEDAAPIASQFAVEFDQTELARFKLASDLDDAAKSYHVTYRKIWLDPAQLNAFNADFVLVSSGTPVDDFILLNVYIAPDGSPLLLNLSGGYTSPSHPLLNLGLTDLTEIEHHFSVYPDPISPYLPSSDFVLPYTSQSYVTREVEEIGVIRNVTHVEDDGNVLSRQRRCAPVDKARRPPPGQNIIQVDPPRDPPPTPTVVYVIPQRIVYMINHALSVTLLDGTPVPMSSINLSLDVDSFAWAFRGVLADKAALPLVQQPANGQPVQLIATINGVSFKLLVERIDHSRQFGQRQIALSGRGLTALLGQPYQQPQSATQASDLTVQQLAELQLPPGWAITWDLPTWTVPNGAFTYTAQTPIQVLLSIANDIGAIIKPSRNAQTMTFMRRYKVGPWQFNQATPDLYVPESAILSATMRPPVPIDINGVYVHGSEIGGIIGWCRLTGTDGAKLAQTVSNNLITDVEGARLLGERVLAANQTQPAIQSVTLPFDNIDFPLAEVGWLTQVTIDNVQVRGIINAVSIEASLGNVRQTLQIGDETPNNWSLFNDLLPRDPLLVGTLSSTNGVTSLMTLLDGGVIRVRGTGSVGNKYYVRGSKIESAAPNLNQVEIVI